MRKAVAKAWDFLWRARPMGQAFVLAFAVMVFSGVVALLFMPSVGMLKLTVQQIPEAYERGEHGPIADGELAGEELPGCRWGLPADLEKDDLAGPPAPRRLLCDESAAAEMIDHEYPLMVLRERVSGDSGWQVVDHTFSLRMPPRQPPLALAAYLGIFLLVTGILLRNLRFGADLVRARDVVLRQPWVLAVVPLAMFGGAVLFNTLLPVNEARMAEMMDLFEAAAPGALGMVVVLPLFEEAVFRQWLYVRTIDKLPAWAVAIGSAWFFMLVHAFNPQVMALPGYLPTVFVGGLAFFWIRHRFGSFSLAALAHMLNNGLALGLGWMLQN